MPKDRHTYTFTNRMPFLRLREHIEMRHKVRNSNGSFLCHPLTPMDLARWDSRLMNTPLSDTGRLAWLMDSPDYVVECYGFPIMWHSTTRPAESSWVCPFVANPLPTGPSPLRVYLERVALLQKLLNNTEAEEQIGCQD
jgi:hypothetical protein